METFFMNSKNSKTIEPNRFKYDLILFKKSKQKYGIR